MYGSQIGAFKDALKTCNIQIANLIREPKSNMKHLGYAIKNQ